MDATLVTLAMVLTRKCSRILVTPKELAFARRRAKSMNLEATRPTETAVANEINKRPTNTNVLTMSTVKTNAQEQALAIVVKITPTSILMTGISALHLTARWISSPTVTVIALALVNTSQVVVTIVVVAVDMTPTEMITGMVVMLITLAKDDLVLALAHALVVATSLQVALKVDHAVPAVDVLEA